MTVYNIFVEPLLLYPSYTILNIFNLLVMQYELLHKYVMNAILIIVATARTVPYFETLQMRHRYKTHHIRTRMQ